MSKVIPNHLGKKLRKIREFKGLTLDEMAKLLGRKEKSRRARIYEWEIGKRTPDLPTLLKYAKVVNVSTDILIDDNKKLSLDDNKS